MRALLSFAGGSGHALPMMPIARALAGRGHEVLFTGQPAMLDQIRGAGFDAVDSGGSTLAAATDRRVLVRADRDAEVRVIRESFAGGIARERAPKVLGVGEDFDADIIIHDEIDFGAAVAAERLGVPHASVVVLAAGGMITPGLLDEPLNRLCAELGVSARPDLLDRFLTLAPVMPSFRDPRSPFPPSTLAIRPDVLADHQEREDPAVDRVEAFLAAQPDRPLVYLTLGTVFHQESGDLFTRVLTGLERMAANVVVTVGRELDPAELGVRNERVLVERFVAHRAVLPRAALVVSHAGSGTVVSALACGVPLMLLPLGADQPWNADRCVALGVGRMLDALTVSPGEAAAAAEDVLRNATYRAAARVLSTEAEALPRADAAVGAIEQLVS
ncbi:glycosyltransferase [uncultured Jatrophihabitans sp.]|uniref:glycosyltransferase n=1 Tax=uncultured Jatrophihabitans sp. TaxID=1610747 RepID=UPI0035CBD140